MGVVGAPIRRITAEELKRLSHPYGRRHDEEMPRDGGGPVLFDAECDRCGATIGVGGFCSCPSRFSRFLSRIKKAVTA